MPVLKNSVEATLRALENSVCEITNGRERLDVGELTHSPKNEIWKIGKAVFVSGKVETITVRKTYAVIKLGK